MMAVIESADFIEEYDTHVSLKIADYLLSGEASFCEGPRRLLPRVLQVFHKTCPENHILHQQYFCLKCKQN